MGDEANLAGDTMSDSGLDLEVAECATGTAPNSPGPVDEEHALPNADYAIEEMDI